MKKVISILFWGFATILSGCTTTNISSTLEEYGFPELKPPSNLISPGTLITAKGTNPFIVGIICPQENALGQDIKNSILISDSSVSNTAKDLTGTFKLDAKYLSQINANINFKSIESINISLSNVKVLELPDDAVLENIKHRSPSCSAALQLRRKQGARVAMVKSVVSADATYSLKYNTELSAAAKAEITEKVAGELDLGRSSSEIDKVSGTGLFWGLRDDIELAALLPNTLPSTGSGVRNRLIPIGAIVKISE